MTVLGANGVGALLEDFGNLNLLESKSFKSTEMSVLSTKGPLSFEVSSLWPSEGLSGLTW